MALLRLAMRIVLSIHNIRVAKDSILLFGLSKLLLCFP